MLGGHMKPSQKCLAVVAASLLALAQFSYAGPPGGPGDPGPGGPGPGGHHGGHWAGDALGGAVALGLGIGVASLLTRPAPAPAPAPVYVVPNPAPFVPPGYAPPPAPVVVTPVAPAPAGTTMYWCQASRNFYPYVTECSSGWEPRIVSQ
jgi:hypothetical protein